MTETADRREPAQPSMVPDGSVSTPTTESTAETDDTFPAGLRVLQIATSDRSFFTQQVTTLEARGIQCTTVIVPQPGSDGRGFREYVQFYGSLLHEALRGQDLVHANYGLVGPLALAQPVRPIVLTLWGSEVMGDANWLDRWSRFGARHSDAVIAPSEYVSRELHVPHRVIPFGVDTKLFRPIDREQARERVGWGHDEHHVLFPYDPDRPVKNYPLAKRVVGRLGPRVTLHTVSGVPYEEMPYYVNASDALLVTSLRESGPMVVREAAACNVPVVSTDVGFVADVLSDVDGCYIGTTEPELVEGITAVLDDGGRSDGREVVDSLGLERMADGLIETYSQVLDG